MTCWRHIKDARNEASARKLVKRFCKEMTIYGDAADGLQSMVVRELLPREANWREEISGEYGKRFRERVEHLLMNRWRLMHRRVAIAECVDLAASHLADMIGCGRREAKSLLRFEFSRDYEE